MKDLKTHISESLIMSYDHEKLKKRLKKKYKVIRFVDMKSKSKVRSFTMTVDKDEFEKIETDPAFYKLLDFFGYYQTELNYVMDVEEYDIRLEPNFGTKCTDFVYNECDGIIYHVTREVHMDSISKKGLIPMAGKSYREFPERIFFSCGKDKHEVLTNIQDIVDQLGREKYTILEIHLKDHKYNIDFYYDPSEDDKHNYIYANAIIFPFYIDREYDSIDELKEWLDSIIEKRYFNGKQMWIRKISRRQ